MCGYARKYHAEGVLNTDWGDCGHINQPDFSLPGMIYGAVFSWGDDTDSFEELNEQISRLAYGDRSGKFVSYMAKRQNAPSLTGGMPTSFTRKSARSSEQPECAV